VIPHFEWDLEKARENVRKHGVSFEEAASTFGDDDAVLADDLAHDDDEDRFIIVGMSARERVAPDDLHDSSRGCGAHHQ